MGADLLLATLVVDEDKTLQWVKVEDALADMADNEVLDAVQSAFGEPQYDTIEEEREGVRKLFGLLKDLVEHGGRDVDWFTVRGARVYISGGMSWGDDPSDGFTIISGASYFPKILTAVGFEGFEEEQSNDG